MCGHLFHGRARVRRLGVHGHRGHDIRRLVTSLSWAQSCNLVIVFCDNLKAGSPTGKFFCVWTKEVFPPLFEIEGRSVISATISSSHTYLEKKNTFFECMACFSSQAIYLGCLLERRVFVSTTFSCSLRSFSQLPAEHIINYFHVAASSNYIPLFTTPYPKRFKSVLEFNLPSTTMTMNCVRLRSAHYEHSGSPPIEVCRAASFYLD